MMVWRKINAQDREYGKAYKKSDGKEKNKMCVGYFVKGEKIVKRERLEVEDDTN